MGRCKTKAVVTGKETFSRPRTRSQVSFHQLEVIDIVSRNASQPLGLSSQKVKVSKNSSLKEMPRIQSPRTARCRIARPWKRAKLSGSSPSSKRVERHASPSSNRAQSRFLASILKEAAERRSLPSPPSRGAKPISPAPPSTGDESGGLLRRQPSRPGRTHSQSESSRPKPSSPRPSHSQPSRAGPSHSRPRSLHDHSRLSQLQSLSGICREKLIFPESSFRRFIMQMLASSCRYAGYRWTGRALEALQESAEIYLANLFEDSYIHSIINDRVTIRLEDMQQAALNPWWMYGIQL